MTNLIERVNSFLMAVGPYDNARLSQLIKARIETAESDEMRASWYCAKALQQGPTLIKELKAELDSVDTASLQRKITELERACESYRSQLAEKCEQTARMKLDLGHIKSAYDSWKESEADRSQREGEYANRCFLRSVEAEVQVAKLTKKVKKLKKKLK